MPYQVTINIKGDPGETVTFSVPLNATSAQLYQAFQTALVQLYELVNA